MHLFARLTIELSRIRPFLPTYAHLLASALFAIFTGAHASLSRPSSAAPSRKKKKGAKTPDDEEPSIQKLEGFRPSDAILFPVMAGTVLTSLFLLLKYLKDPALLNRLLGYYFAQVGLVFATRFLKDCFSVIRSFAFPREFARRGVLWKVDEGMRCHEGVNANSSRSTTSTSTRPESKVQKQASPLPGILQNIPLAVTASDALWTLHNLLYKHATLNLHIHSLLTLKSRLDILDLASLLLSTLITVYFTFISKPWPLTNLLGFAFSYGSLQYMSPTTFWTGTLILSSLFLYDVYFVFFTPMMVTVATKLDVPIKLLFPRPRLSACLGVLREFGERSAEYLDCVGIEEGKGRAMSMLGLGDVVVPGMMVGLALRFDLYLHYKRKRQIVVEDDSDYEGLVHTHHHRKQKEEDRRLPYLPTTGSWGERFWTHGLKNPQTAELEAKRFPKPYFYASLVGYVAGMVATLLVMQIAEHAQPALLYLVPGVLGALWGTALVRGEVGEMWAFTEEEKKDGEQKKKKKESPQEGKDDETSVKSEVEDESAEDDSAIAVSTRRESNSSKRESDKKRQDNHKTRELISFSITLPPSSSHSASPSTSPENPHNPGSNTNANSKIEQLPSSSSSSDQITTETSPLKPPYTNAAISTGNNNNNNEPAVKRRKVHNGIDHCEQSN